MTNGRKRSNRIHLQLYIQTMAQQKQSIRKPSSKKAKSRLWPMRISNERFSRLEFIAYAMGWSKSHVMQEAFDQFCILFLEQLSWHECLYVCALIDRKYNKMAQLPQGKTKKQTPTCGASDLTSYFKRKTGVPQSDPKPLSVSNDTHEQLWAQLFEMHTTHPQKARKLARQAVIQDLYSLIAEIVPATDSLKEGKISFEESYKTGQIDKKTYLKLKENPTAFGYFCSLMFRRINTNNQSLDQK